MIVGNATKFIVGNGISYTMLTISRTNYFWLHWVFAAAWAFSRCGERRLLSSWGVRAAHCGGFSCCSSVVVAHEVSCPAACGIFPDQEWNPCPCLGV